MTIKSLTLVAATLALLASCTKAHLLETPDHFLALEQAQASRYEYRATTADGVVMALRVLEIDPQAGGDVQFWVDAIELRLRQMGGYELLDTSDVKTKKGLAGKQLNFGRDEKQRPYRYTVAVFLTDRELLVLEAGGPEAKFKMHSDRIQTAIASLDP